MLPSAGLRAGGLGAAAAGLPLDGLNACHMEFFLNFFASSSQSPRRESGTVVGMGVW
jgi:hypothetical protein